MRQDYFIQPEPFEFEFDPLETRFEAEQFEAYSEFNEYESFVTKPEVTWPGNDGRGSGIFVETETEFTFFGFPNSILEALRKGLESVAVRLAVTFGFRDQNMLTNLVFFARHPERAGRKLVKEEKDYNNLSQEWLNIHKLLVGPALKQQPQIPATPSSTVHGMSGMKTLYAKLRLLPELTEDQRLFLMLVAYGESRGSPTAHNDTSSEIAASEKAWDKHTGLRAHLLGCGLGGRAEWAIGSGGYFGRLVPYFGDDMRAIGCVGPRDVFDPHLSIVSGILTAYKLQQWDSWKANPTVGTLRTGWGWPANMSDPPPEKLAKYIKHAKKVGLPPDFVSRTLTLFPGPSKARAILARLKSGA